MWHQEGPPRDMCCSLLSHFSLKKGANTPQGTSPAHSGHHSCSLWACLVLSVLPHPLAHKALKHGRLSTLAWNTIILLCERGTFQELPGVNKQSHNSMLALALRRQATALRRQLPGAPLPPLPRHVSTHNQPHLNSKCKSLPGFPAIPVAQDGVAAMEMASQTGGRPDVGESCT